MHQVGLDLTCDHDEFADWTRSYLSLLLDPSEATPDVQVTLEWNADPSAEIKGDLAQLGRRIWTGVDRLYLAEIWQVPGLHMDIGWQDGPLNVHAFYNWPKRRAKWLATVVASARQRLYASLVYYLVYFPYVWWLERKRGWTLLHASAIASPQGGLVFSGLPGCGKSTTSLAVLGSPQWRIVSDNLLLVDGNHVFACPEPIRVDAEARSLVGDLAGRIRSAGRRFSYQREDYEIVPEARQPSALSLAMGFLHVGRETGVEPVGQQPAARRLMANDYLAREWMAYQESAAAMHQVWPDVGDQERRARNLNALSQAGPCYDVTVGRGKPVHQEIERMAQVMLNGAV
jgi:hypothetical protein